MRRVFIIQIVFLMGFIGCHKDEPCPTCPSTYHQTVFLDTILVEPTEIDLHLTTSDSIHGSSTLFQVRRDSMIIFSHFVLQKDTVIVDTGLLPSHVYKYKALRLTKSIKTDSSKILSLRTMDTTSHNFVWTVDTLGDGANSLLRDVAILNDTCVWAVGDLHRKDSTSQFETDPYNAAHWNGSSWTYERIYYLYQGQNFYSALYSIVIFSPNDIWVGSNQPQHWNGSAWQEFDLPGTIFNGYINKIWARNSSDVYIVGAAGAIAHYDGTTWQKMDSGTDVDLTDVWGSPDGSIVWACGYNSNKIGTILLKNDHGTGWQIAYDGTQHENPSILNDSLCGVYTSVFSPSQTRLFVASPSGLYQTKSTTHGEAKRLSFTTTNFPGLPTRLRGNASNDMTIVGAYDFIAHYNGSTWRYFSELGRLDQGFRSGAQHGNLVDCYDN